MAMELKHLNPQYVMDVTGKAIDEISRLRAENAELKEQYKDMDVTHTVHIAKMNAKIDQLEEDVAWNKYKRCLAMAKWCDAQVEWYNTLNEDYSFWIDLYVKWHRRWLKIAEKFMDKEAE